MPVDREISQARSRTAILAYLAARAAGQPSTYSRLTDWFSKNGLKIRERGLKDALTLRLHRQGAGPSEGVEPTGRDWIREALDVDLMKLDLDFAVVISRDSDASEFVRVLERSKRAIRIFRSYDGIVALIAHDGPLERRELHALLEEHDPEFDWLVVREVDDSSAAETWLSLARKIAAVERLRS